MFTVAWYLWIKLIENDGGMFRFHKKNPGEYIWYLLSMPSNTIFEEDGFSSSSDEGTISSVPDLLKICYKNDTMVIHAMWWVPEWKRGKGISFNYSTMS